MPLSTKMTFYVARLELANKHEYGWLRLMPLFQWISVIFCVRARRFSLSLMKTIRPWASAETQNGHFPLWKLGLGSKIF